MGIYIGAVALPNLAAVLTAVLAALAGCTNQGLLKVNEDVREELEMLRERLARLEADTAKHSRKIQELTDLEEGRAEEAERDEPVPAEDLAVGRPVDSSGEATEAGGEGEQESMGTHEVPADPFARRVQIALERAGYDPGPVDGRAGAKTKKAIREFQRDNNLPESGVADEATWNLLKRYLE